jgi:hypothetical protein
LGANAISSIASIQISKYQQQCSIEKTVSSPEPVRDVTKSQARLFAAIELESGLESFAASNRPSIPILAVLKASIPGK